MTGSRSRRIALFLDCCYSGAFARGAAVRGGDAIDIADRFGGRGHVVITASSAMEYSFEGDDVSGVGRASVFTTALVQGLQNGAADRDGDGVVSIDELYEYVYARVQEETPSQTPRKWTYDLEGDFVVAMNPNATSVASEVLPPALIEAMTNPFASVRKVAVEEFARLRTSGSSLLAEAAERALARLVDDSDPDVSRAAATALATGDSEPQGERPTDPRAPEARRPSDRGQPPTPDGSTVPRSGRRSAAKRRSDGSIVPEVATDTPDMRARREQLWAHIRELGFGPHSGWRTWYHPSIAGARFTDKKNNINFERFLPDGKWHVWETFPLYSSADDLAIQSSISFVSQHVDEHSPMWQQWVDSLPPDDRRMWMNAYAAGKANPWY